jgi:hypothetical protein
MGMIELSKISIRVNCTGTYLSSGDCNNTITILIITSTLNNILDRVFIYQSNMPTLVLGLHVPSEMRVYLPVNTTKPMTEPLANTVLVQSVFSKESFYFLPAALNSDTYWNTASKL